MSPIITYLSLGMFFVAKNNTQLLIYLEYMFLKAAIMTYIVHVVLTGYFCCIFVGVQSYQMLAFP